MDQTIFGKTDLKVGRTGFGCIPIQRIPYDESTAILRRAYEGGVTCYDTANGYTTSEERIGIAFEGMRDKVVICTKSGAGTPDALMANLENSLKMMKTDYVDVLQFHNPSFVPMPGGEDGMYDCLKKAQQQGKVRHIGISAHKKEPAIEAVKSGLYAVLQFPISYLSSAEELAIIELCREHNVGLLAMKALCGGILNNAKAAFAFLRQYENVIPIWGIQKMDELEEFLRYEDNAPALDAAVLKEIEADKAELAGSFCRACGYCLPCPAQIPIPMAARMSFLMGRMPSERFLQDEWQENMRRIEDCSDCGNCTKHCPYELDVPGLLKEQRATYLKNLA